MINASGNHASRSPEYSPALLSAVFKATADNLDQTPVAVVVEDALMTAYGKGWAGPMALMAVVRALRDTAAVVDNLSIGTSPA